MESSSSTVRRRAWIHSSRHWLTLEEPDSEGPLCDLPSASIADDDVFSEECSTGKIESWLLSCGSNTCLKNSGHLHVESMLKANSFDDDLSLGADASALKAGEITSEVGQHCRFTTSSPLQELGLPSLNMGHSMASSCPSSSIIKTSSSVSEVLHLCSEDAEETLYQLGFGCDEPQVTARIPPRFFSFPSQAQGINFRLFLEAQLRRMREEDPSLSLASRFRQVQVLTEMANAFYSLYSHVSRTPLQKLGPPEFSFSSSPVERIGRFRSSCRSEPRSPVERLKDTVSKMCLYTGSPRGSDSISPQPSPRKRSSLPDIVEIALEKVKAGPSKKLYLDDCNRTNSTMDFNLISDGDKSFTSELEDQMTMDTDNLQRENEISYKEMLDNNQADKLDTDKNKPTDLESRTQGERTSVVSSLSGETVIETDQTLLSVCDARPADLNSSVKVTYDVIWPQIVECTCKASFCQQTKGTKLNALLAVTCKTENSLDRSFPGSQRSHLESQIQTAMSEAQDGSHLGSKDDACSLEAGQAGPSGNYIPYCITVTGWEGDNISSYSVNTADSNHFPPVHACEESLRQGKSQYLNPLGHISKNLQQVNSFELEEVHSAGEDDFGHSESTRSSTSELSPKQCKGLVVRGDSMQSDSSGYADEEVSPSSDRNGR
ncbi:hypothetical protein LDENG_00169470 [Lucifuga dentata]|nr:hypothetical protein LDENG_00169470 [Lucifuga dentata]